MICQPVFGARKATLPVHVNTHNTHAVFENQDSFQRSAWMQPEGQTPLSWHTRSILYPRHAQHHTEPLLVRRSGPKKCLSYSIVDLMGRLHLSFKLEQETIPQPSIFIKDLKGIDVSNAELDEVFRYIFAEQQATKGGSTPPWTLTLAPQANLHLLTAQLNRLGWQASPSESAYTLSSRAKARYHRLHQNEPIQLNRQEDTPYTPTLSKSSSPRPKQITVPKGKRPPTVLIGDFFDLKSPSLPLGQAPHAPKTTHGHLVDAVLVAHAPKGTKRIWFDIPKRIGSLNWEETATALEQMVAYIQAGHPANAINLSLSLPLKLDSDQIYNLPQRHSSTKTLSQEISSLQRSYIHCFPSYERILNAMKFFEQQKIPVFSTAGNKGFFTLNGYLLTKGVHGVGALKPNGEKAPYSGDNPLITHWALGEYTLTPVLKVSYELSHCLGYSLFGDQQVDLPASALVFNDTSNPFNLPQTADSGFTEDTKMPQTPLTPVAYAGTSFSTPAEVARYLNTIYQT